MGTESLGKQSSFLELVYVPFAHVLFKHDHSVRQREAERIRILVQEK